MSRVNDRRCAERHLTDSDRNHLTIARRQGTACSRLQSAAENLNYINGSALKKRVSLSRTKNPILFTFHYGAAFFRCSTAVTSLVYRRIEISRVDREKPINLFFFAWLRYILLPNIGWTHDHRDQVTLYICSFGDTQPRLSKRQLR